MIASGQTNSAASSDHDCFSIMSFPLLRVKKRMLTAARVMPSDTRPTHSPEAIGSIVLIQTLSQDSEVVLARLIDSLQCPKLTLLRHSSVV